MGIPEDDLGTALLTRTTCAPRLTERGAADADRCRELLANLDELQSQVRGDDAKPRSALSVTAPVIFGRLHILPVAEATAGRFPNLEFRLTFLDRVTHLVEERFDLAVRIGALSDPSMISVKLTEVRRVVVDGPAYLAAHGMPFSPVDLRQDRIVSFDGVGSTDGKRFGPDGAVAVRVCPRQRVNMAEAAIDVVKRGTGLTQLLSYQVEDPVRSSRPRIFLTSAEPAPIPVGRSITPAAAPR